MTAKEKAKELVGKYYINIPLRDCDNRRPHKYALIAIDEIIKYHESLYNKGLKDVHIAISSPIKTYDDILNPLLKYWQEVKEEINKL